MFSLDARQHRQSKALEQRHGLIIEWLFIVEARTDPRRLLATQRTILTASTDSLSCLLEQRASGMTAPRKKNRVRQAPDDQYKGIWLDGAVLNEGVGIAIGVEAATQFALGLGLGSEVRNMFSVSFKAF